MRGRTPKAAAGFTLLELMVVMVIIAIATGLMTLALRDSADSQLEREAVRLAAVLDGARAQARISGANARFELATPPDSGFRIVGLPAEAIAQMPHQFLDPDTQAVVVGAKAVPLGPEPMLGPQRILLKLGEREITLGTDGVAPFGIVPPAGAEPVPGNEPAAGR